MRYKEEIEDLIVKLEVYMALPVGGGDGERQFNLTETIEVLRWLRGEESKVDVLLVGAELSNENAKKFVEGLPDRKEKFKNTPPNPSPERQERGTVNVISGHNNQEFENISPMTVAQIQDILNEVFNISPSTVPHVNGVEVDGDFATRPGDILEFQNYTNPNRVLVNHGPNMIAFEDLPGSSVLMAMEALREVFNIPWNATPIVNGNEVAITYTLQPNDTLEFVA